MWTLGQNYITLLEIIFQKEPKDKTYKILILRVMLKFLIRWAKNLFLATCVATETRLSVGRHICAMPIVFSTYNIIQDFLAAAARVLDQK